MNIIIIDNGEGAVLINPVNIYFIGDGIDFYPATGESLHVKWMEEEIAEKNIQFFSPC
jgi:hypothetical protein